MLFLKKLDINNIGGSVFKVYYEGNMIGKIDVNKDEHLNIDDSNRRLFNKRLNQYEWFDSEFAQKLVNWFDAEKSRIISTPEEEEFEVEIVDKWETVCKIIQEQMSDRCDEFKLFLSTIVSYWFSDKDCIFLLIVAAKGQGKSETINCFSGDEDAYLVEDVTYESFAPGTAQSDQTSMSLLRECEDKTLIIHDMTTLLGSSEEKKDKVFSMFINSYGKEPFSKFSPGGGLIEFGGGYNMIAAITPREYMKNISRFSNTGRFFVYKFPSLNQYEIIMRKKNHPDTHKVKMSLLGFLKYLRREKLPIIEINDDLRDLMARFLEVFTYYRLVYAKTGEKMKLQKYDAEGIIRTFNQLEMLIKAKCFIEGRSKAGLNDFIFFKEFLFGLDNAPTRKKKLDVLEKVVKIDEDLFEFFGCIPSH